MTDGHCPATVYTALNCVGEMIWPAQWAMYTIHADPWKNSAPTCFPEPAAERPLLFGQGKMKNAGRAERRTRREAERGRGLCSSRATEKSLREVGDKVELVDLA